METDLPIEKVQTKTPRKNPRREPPAISYNIVEDVLDQPANISVRDLITTTPRLRRDLIGACRLKRKSPNKKRSQETMALIEDEDINTTAAYTKIIIGNQRIKTLVDCGAAKTCISKSLADALKLDIDAASESVFTLGNGTKQPALGMIYDVPIEVSEDLVIPCTVEVLPTCPSHFIIGNNWLSRAKARIDFNSASLKVSYKNRKAELPISFLRKKDNIPKMTTYQQMYQNPTSLTNSTEKKVRFEKDGSEENNSTGEDSEDTSESELTEESNEEDYSTEDESSEEERNDTDSLLVLNNDDTQELDIVRDNTEIVIQAPKEGMVLKAHTSNSFQIKKPTGTTKNNTYSLEITNKDITQVMGYFDISTSIVINKKSIDVHLYNRSDYDIYLKPYEEVGRLEAFDLQNEEMVQAYQLNRDTDLYVLEEDQAEHDTTDNESLDQETYTKLEIGKIGNDIAKRLKKLIHKFKNIFDWNNDTIGHTQLINHKIVIEENTQPISHRPYRLSPIESDYLQKELEKYCKLGVIAPSNSPWAAPVILVKKKNGEYRMVIDYRKLNAITKKDSYPLPRIDDLLDALGKANVFSALDMRAGFHQVPVEESSKELTAFTTKYGISALEN
ncbi:hypothetical protein G6F57_013005 [Rhizopus arrhizus]|nr:hypothetical protein G6F57_013005 [Rhizopus arrhizus]